MPAMTTRSVLSGSAVLASLLLLAGCGGAASGDATAGPGSSLGKKTATAGPVEVVVTPKRLTRQGAVFAVDLNNHEMDLTGDYAKGSTLSVGGRSWGTPTWTGDAPGGHHRGGRLSFAAAGEPTGAAVLRIGGLPEPVTVRWVLR